MNDLFDRRASRLALLYPRVWRKRYPDFVEVLALELADHPWKARRNVICSAGVERLRSSGLLPTGPADRARSGLALTYAVLIPFAGLAIGMWSQLHTGLVAQGRDALPVLRAADLLLAIGTLIAVASFVIAIAVISGRVLWSKHDLGASSGSRVSQLVRPTFAFVGSVAALTLAGWAADRSGWYSPAAVALPDRGPVHLVTLWVRGVISTMTPAWIHPSLFGRMPTGELLATFLTPIATIVAGAALMRMIMRLPVSRPRRVDAALAIGTAATMLLVLASCVRWLLAHPTQQGPTPLLTRADQLAPGHTGWGVVILLGGLAFAAVVGAARVIQGRDGLDMT